MSVNCSNHRHTWEVCSAAASELSLNVSEQFSHGPCALEHTHSFHCHLKCYWMNRFYFVRARPDTDTGAPARARPRNEFNFLLSNLVSSFYTMRGRTHTHTHTHARTHARRHARRHARHCFTSFHHSLVRNCFGSDAFKSSSFKYSCFLSLILAVTKFLSSLLLRFAFLNNLYLCFIAQRMSAFIQAASLERIVTVFCNCRLRKI